MICINNKKFLCISLNNSVIYVMTNADAITELQSYSIILWQGESIYTYKDRNRLISSNIDYPFRRCTILCYTNDFIDKRHIFCQFAILISFYFRIIIYWKKQTEIISN